MCKYVKIIFMTEFEFNKVCIMHLFILTMVNDLNIE